MSSRQSGRFFYPRKPEHPMAIKGKELAIACARAAEQIQAEDIRVIDLGGVSSLTDYMVVCSGTSLPHLKAVMRDVEKEMAEQYNVSAVNAEGNADSRWVVLDYIDVMVHIMHDDLRELYGLEDLWANGKEVQWQE
jgi:ribosome-associated protein